MDYKRYCAFLENEVERLEKENLNLLCKIGNEAPQKNNVKPIRPLSKLGKKAAEDIIVWLETGEKSRKNLNKIMDEYTQGVIKGALENLFKRGIVNRRINPKYSKEYLYYLPNKKEV